MSIPRRLLPALLLPTLALASCNYGSIPNEANIDINGEYVGRIVGQDGKSALLDVTVVEKDLRVTGTVKSRDTGETFNAVGTRSVYDASPVTTDMTADLGSGSACEGGFTDKYVIRATFVRKSRYTGAGATGNVTHSVCNASTKLYGYASFNSGSLELSRK
ncbi:hypothetical protein E7T06_03395 [Deinococcus sp. Arct2-2]|uniref:hypothetical protein n=1 Tax=Deinococcus sp. Arct2-2 TaxID=2568653 RepID=UPI0010A34A72|nr:hypothetical protein [Deinococcus sp. Arct2-2]THF71394.1 hypothetical protein E7T06_03395 [Deinococcus sp. Arct2-2]